MPYFSYRSPVISTESCQESGRCVLNYLEEVESPFLRPRSTLATRLEPSLPAIAEPLCKNTGKVDWVWVRGTPYQHSQENMVRRVAALCPGWAFSLHSHSEMVLDEVRSSRPFEAQTAQAVCRGFWWFEEKPRILKLSLENFLGTFKMTGEGEEVTGWCSWPSGLQPCTQGPARSAVRARVKQDIWGSPWQVVCCWRAGSALSWKFGQ